MARGYKVDIKKANAGRNAAGIGDHGKVLNKPGLPDFLLKGISAMQHALG